MLSCGSFFLEPNANITLDTEVSQLAVRQVKSYANDMFKTLSKFNIIQMLHLLRK